LKRSVLKSDLKAVKVTLLRVEDGSRFHTAGTAVQNEFLQKFEVSAVESAVQYLPNCLAQLSEVDVFSGISLFVRTVTSERLNVGR